MCLYCKVLSDLPSDIIKLIGCIFTYDHARILSILDFKHVDWDTYACYRSSRPEINKLCGKCNTIYHSSPNITRGNFKFNSDDRTVICNSPPSEENPINIYRMSLDDFYREWLMIDRSAIECCQCMHMYNFTIILVDNMWVEEHKNKPHQVDHHEKMISLKELYTGQVDIHEVGPLVWNKRENKYVQYGDY